MKKGIALFLSVVMLVSGILTGCTPQDSQDKEHIEENLQEEVRFDNLNEPEMLHYVENSVYTQLIDELDSTEYFVENVSAIYISKEYVEELSYNSKENIYFGYTLAELEAQFQGTPYIFTVGEDGQTVVQEFANADTTYDEIMRNVAIGAGVILVCVTVSAAAGIAGASAVSMIFAASAKTGTAFALSSGVFSAFTAGVVTGIETQDFNQALESAAAAGSEGFKWGAMGGVLFGGIKEAMALKGATLNGLTMKEAAQIQKESKYPIDVIKQFASKEQYKICKSAGLTPQTIKGKTMLVRKIDLNLKDNMGRTNLQRMKQGLAAVDSSGKPYELHHIGQKADSTLAVLSKAEHMQKGNNKIWHVLGEETQVHGAGNTWDIERKEIWKALAEYLEKAN